MSNSERQRNSIGSLTNRDTEHRDRDQAVLVTAVAAADPQEDESYYSDQPRMHSPSNVLEDNPRFIFVREGVPPKSWELKEQTTLMVDVGKLTYSESGEIGIVSTWAARASSPSREDEVEVRYSSLDAGEVYRSRTGTISDKFREVSIRKVRLWNSECMGVYLGGVLDVAVPVVCLTSGRLELLVESGQQIGLDTPVIKSSAKSQYLVPSLYPRRGPEARQRNYFRRVKSPFVLRPSLLSKVLPTMVEEFAAQQLGRKGGVSDWRPSNTTTMNWLRNVSLGFNELFDLSKLGDIPMELWSTEAQSRFALQMNDVFHFKALRDGEASGIHDSVYSQHLDEMYDEKGNVLAVIPKGGIYSDKVIADFKLGKPVHVSKGQRLEVLDMRSSGFSEDADTLREQFDVVTKDAFQRLFWLENVSTIDGRYWVGSTMLSPEGLKRLRKSANPTLGFRTDGIPENDSRRNGQAILARPTILSEDDVVDGKIQLRTKEVSVQLK